MEKRRGYSSACVYKLAPCGKKAVGDLPWNMFPIPSLEKTFFTPICWTHDGRVFPGMLGTLEAVKQVLLTFQRPLQK